MVEEDPCIVLINEKKFLEAQINPCQSSTPHSLEGAAEVSDYALTSPLNICSKLTTGSF